MTPAFVEIQNKISTSSCQVKVTAEKVNIKAQTKISGKQKRANEKKKKACPDLYPVNLEFTITENQRLVLKTTIRGAKYQQNADIKPGDAVFPTRRFRDVHDSNCIEVLNTKHDKCGFIPREYARILSPLMDQNYLLLQTST